MALMLVKRSVASYADTISALLEALATEATG
jgi:hypothetical protein